MTPRYGLIQHLRSVGYIVDDPPREGITALVSPRHERENLFISTGIEEVGGIRIGRSYTAAVNIRGLARIRLLRAAGIY